MKRLILVSLSILTLSVAATSPALALNQRFRSAREDVMNKLNDRFEKEYQDTLNKLNDRFKKEYRDTLDR